MLEVDGVKYISGKYAQTIYGIAKVTWNKKVQKCGILGRRLDNTRTHYFTLEEAEKIVRTADYITNKPHTTASHLRIIVRSYRKIAERMDLMKKMGMIPNPNWNGLSFESRLAQLHRQTQNCLRTAEELSNMADLREGKKNV